MGRRKVSLLHWRLLTQVLVFSVSIVHASKVLDEVPIPEDSELDQTPLRRRRFIVESDDEDFVTSAEGSADFEEGSTPVTVETEHTTLATTEIPEGKTKSSVYPLMIPVVAEMNSSPEPPQYVYYRVLVNFTTSIEYSSQLEDFDSEAFREISEGIIDTLESEFYRIPGDQTVTVVWIKQVDQNVIVELDVGSDGNDNDEEIREVVYSVVRSGSIGPYETSDQGFKFRHLGDDKIPPHRQCLPNEFSCGSGECIPLDYRCDFRADCKDMSDEADCARVITTVSPSPTVRVKVPVTTTTPVIVTVKPERRTPRPLVTPAPATSTPDFLRPCSIDQAVCQNGQCIPRDYLCDGERDCTDGSDELDCGAPSPCEPNEFMCKNGRCALKLWRCDGDNDCMDNSDEEYCPTKGPGDMCAPEQFVCVSTRQCIPASYQCDEEADCPDRSDEFGCTPPQVITPPEETVMVKRGATVTLTCVAAGVPTPIITWRLNWGHIPVSSRITMTSQNGQGTLIIRDAKESDQGAYTCEAINAKGMIFAIPDALLILKSNPGVCSEGQFHVEGSLQCLPCFCFGVTRNCESANRYRNQIHLRFTEEDNFMGVNVTAAAQPVTPPVSTSQMIVDPDSGEFQLVDLSRRFLSHDSFWTLPRQFLGDKVDSYGGSLRFKVRYSVARGQSEPEEKADVIITGNGRKLVYKTRTSTYPDVINQKEILFTEDNWQHESGLPVTREDLMMTLANLDKIMIRTKYDNKMSSIGLSDIVMDTTSVEFTTMGKPKLVEQCRCPPSYKGLSCETCARGFKRVLTGPYLGVCDGCSCNGHASSCDKVTGYCLSCRHNTEGPHCDKCKPGFFGDPTRGTANDCMPCPCPFTDSRRRFSETCFLDTDGRPTCDACSEGYTGRRCEICAAGYEGNPMSPGGKCKPHAGHFSNCDSRGTKSTESYAGSCVCKANVIGRLCNQCATGSFNLNDANLDGCVKCFCMGISKECTSSSWHRDQVRALYDEQESNLYMLTNMAHTQRIIEGIKISALSELTFANFDAIPRDIYYWVLPDRFKGDKVTSYGGELHYTILHNVSPDSLPVTGMPDVVLQGNNIFLEHYTAKRPQPGIPSTFSVSFKETAWRRADGQPATREHLLMALANINAFMIRASYTEGTTESRISQIRMDVAVPHSTGQEQAVEVEECICPEGYKGSSCQECAFGYRRTTSGLYLGMCERCDCNGHSDCDADTGECLKCQHDTKGLRCERCESGFYGNARGGTPNDCKPCPCPGTTPSNQFSSTCFLGADGQATCDHCPSGYEGRNCERCASGYTGNPMYGQSCTTGCTCDWRGSARGQCDANGQCQCKPHVQGRTCDACEAGYFYLSAENREGCLPCFCMGVTQQCSSSSYYRNVVSSPFVPPNNFQNFSLVNRQRTTRITSGFTVTVRDRQPQLSFGRFGQYTQESYYWQLPEVFQGDKREQFFARIRRGHKKDPSLTEDQLRKDAAIWELLSTSSSFPRVKRSSKSVPDLEEQKRIDDEIWAIISGFTAEQSHKPRVRGPPGGSNLSNASHPLSRLASARPAEPPALSSPRKPSSHSIRTPSSSRAAISRSSRPSSLLSRPGDHKKMRNIPQTPSLQTQESSNLIPSPVSGLRPGGFEKHSLLYKGFSLLPESNYYWRLPHQYLGNKVTSYGGLLRYTLSYDAGYRGSSVPDADVQIIGNDITLVTYHHHPLQPREIQSFEIMFKEQFWKRPDGQQATREHLLMVLADLDEVLIRATYSTDMISASLSDVSMEVAVPYYTNMAQALQVEECRCPPAYHGLSCQDCAPGYTRTGGGLYLGDCKLCECNGHSDSCHPETGVCSNCLHNTAGEFCDQCAPGYYGDATVGTPEDCQPCACPLTNQENQFSPICESSRVGGYRCTACLPGYTGQHCERCAPGYSGNPRVAGQKCHPVDHNPFLVTIIPRRATVEQGSTVILKCQVVGQAPFYYYWSRADGHPLSNRVQQRQQGEELVIREIKSADAGIYICTCRNMQSTNSSQTEIIVTVPHFKAITVTVEEPRTQTVRSGVTVNFICTAKSQSPAYTLVWTRQLGGKLPSTAMDFNGILTIRTVRPEDAGVYVCTGSNMFAMDEGTAELHVPATSQLHFQSLETLEGNKQSAAPVATVEPAILTVKQGQTAEFRCTATGNPLPTLEWFGGQGNIISPNAVIQGGLLRIVAVERSDEAEYSCKASNNAGYHIATSILYVQGSGNLPQVQVSPERIEVPEGDTVRLYCRAGGQPSPVISWKKYGGELPPQAISIFGFFPRGTSKNAQVLQRRIQELQAKVERLDIGTLIIPSITVAQAGVYLCVGTNAAGSSEGRIEVSVLTSEGSVPVIRIHPSPGSVTEGDTLELYCHVTGDPQPKITWRKRSGYLTDNHQVQGPMLRIRQATHADAGDYICHAENSLGMQEVSVSVSVSPSAFPKGTAPIVRIQPSPTSVGEGEMLELHCQATGHPEPRITWYRVAGSLSANHQVQGPVLRIRHMTPADIGDYICRAENEYGAREVKFSVSVTSTPSHQGTAPTVLVHPSPSSVREGDMLELHCQVTGQPEPRITWHRSAGSLTSNHQVQGRVLRILRMRPADVGDYICRAENIYGTQEVKFSVLVLPSTSQGTAPTVLVHPSPSSVREGDMLELHCQVTGQPEPRITWHRSAGSLTSNHQVQGRVLRILRMRPADVGDYICRAENIYGTQEVKFSVLVLPSTSRNAPTVLVQPTPTTVREGEMLQLHCQVTGQPPPRVTWYRAAGSLTTDHQVQGHVLRILRVSPADTGDYICRAENVYGMREVKFSVSVTPSSSQGIAPTVRINPSTTSVSEGEMLELHCQVTGQPEPRVTWHRATGSLTANHQVHGRVLRILHVSPADTGDYICRAENIAGTREFKFSVSLSSTTFTHEGAPIVRVQPQPVSVMEGEMVELHCQITAQPEPMITWYKADGYLTDNHQVEGPVLRILQVTSADDGDYICRAENIFGMQQLKFSVMVTSTTSRELLPIISTGPQDITVIEGGDASFSCQVVDGAQPFSIKWKTPNEPLQANVKISNDGSVIKITRARQRDQGQYKCVAQNRFGSAFSIMTLVVQGPPTVSISPRGPVRLGVGDSVTLECIGMGEPRPTIRWRRVNGRQRNNLPREGNPILTISSARLQDSGTYSCTSSNMFGSVDSQVEVIVERSASTPQVPQVTAEEPSVTVTAGQIATLRCSATGYPTPIIQWSKLRAPLPWQHRIANGSLVIPNVGLQDSGQYICNASNSAGFNELFITLDVETAPYATFDQEVVTVRVGEIIRLHCLSQGTPPITYEWSKVNGSLPSRAVKRNGFLQINLAVVSDSGKYRCMVKNKVGQSDAISTVTVKSPPAVKVSPQIEVRNIGGTVEFTCAATGHPEPRTEWFKEEGQFLSNHRINKGVLRIENIQEGNEGVYVCRASNPFGRVQDSAKLVIQALPIVMINVRASMQMVMVGGSVEFECQAIGDPQPSIRWSKVDGRLSPEVILKNGMLKIDHVKESDAGRYRCTATNDAGSVKSEVVLYVQTVPMIAPQPELKEVTIGSKAVFPCLASGYPEPEITWTKLEGDLPTGAYVENHVLTIPSATTEHTGTYVCTATNEQGTETAYAMLKVRERKIPYFTQDPIAYIALPTIKDAYHEFEISITFRPDAADGMIIYNGQKQTTGADFISFSLVGGRPEFRFDVGSGMATIRHPNPITLGEYHNVVLYRNLTHGSLFVDNDPPINGSSQGNFRGLDLNEELYVGGYPHFENISKVTGSNSGFMGCIRKLVIQGDEVIFSAPDLKARGISDCPTCKDNPCKNGGQCIDSETGSYACHCRKGYTGSNCEHSLALHCHPEACGSDATCVNRPDGLGYICRCHLGKQGPKCMDGVLITSPSFRGGHSFVAYPPLTNIHNELTIELEFKPYAPTGLMFYSSGQRMKMNDFISVAMLNGHLEFRYDLGSGLAVLQSANPVALNKWHRLKAHRHNKDGLLKIDDEKEIRKVSPGKSQGLNLRSPMYLGGVPSSEVLPKAVNVTEGMEGCITKVSINGKKVDLSYTFTDSLNVDQCYDSSPCDRAPCLHGGRCIVTGEYEYQCICTNEYQGENCEISWDICLQGNPCMNGGTCDKNQCWCPMGYTGSYCELGMSAVTPAPEWHMEGSADSPVQYGAFFHDGGYIVLPKQMFPRSSPTAPETIEMEVHTTSLDGILLWQGVKHGENGKGKDFVALGLQNGHVLFSYQLGSGEANILSEDPINDGEWHRIIAVREGKSGYIQLDGEDIVRGESKGDKVMVNTRGSVYLGGAPDVELFTGGKFTSGITGCIRKVVLVNKRPDQHQVQPVDLRVHAEGGVNARECPS
ncbi:basement membrane-specific heparan sulfate proteoglycan core protein isoform X2 [Stegostoma tigrinum]|uniref:basement membrane-specific heparan sulfate proteoglycan core protein isoform X2 n=1 Tax=Stegostoma tigrinum TaxID=3053191 RepID=UPI0028702526|nr:basement membrane-specific heparan sulfate proteoglycan core protein isoform X2 [Stegostoma tigrinum]